MLEVLEVDLSDAYAVFALTSAFGALWMMQRTTADAGFRGRLPLIKLLHRFCSGVASIVMFTAAASTLYYGTSPRVSDFLVQIALIGVLFVSALRHMAAPLPRSSHNARFQLDHSTG